MVEHTHDGVVMPSSLHLLSDSCDKPTGVESRLLVDAILEAGGAVGSRLSCRPAQSSRSRCAAQGCSALCVAMGRRQGLISRGEFSDIVDGWHVRELSSFGAMQLSTPPSGCAGAKPDNCHLIEPHCDVACGSGVGSQGSLQQGGSASR